MLLILFLSIIFVSLSIMSLGMLLLEFVLFKTLCFLDVGDYFLSHIRNVFDCYLLNYFLTSFPSLLLFWDPYNSNVGLFNVVPEVSGTLLIFFIIIIFYLLCSAAEVSTILSSRSFIYSFFLVVLLLIPSSIFPFQLLSCSPLFIL